MHAGSFSSIAPSHGPSGGQFTHPGSGVWNAGTGSSLYHGNGAGRYGNDGAGQYGNDGAGQCGWGLCGLGGCGPEGSWPCYGGWGGNSGYPYAYNYYPSNVSNYYYSYAPSDNGGAGAAAVRGLVTDPGVAAPQQLPASPAMVPTSSKHRQGASDTLPYYSEARAAFLGGDYQNALWLAGHAGLEAPRTRRSTS